MNSQNKKRKMTDIIINNDDINLPKPELDDDRRFPTSDLDIEADLPTIPILNWVAKQSAVDTSDKRKKKFLTGVIKNFTVLDFSKSLYQSWNSLDDICADLKVDDF